MTLSLREKRRHQTARDIQSATLTLAVQHGLDHITTEEISVAAGVSSRTFFNYYPNKEAAVIGKPPGFQPKDKDALRDGTVSLSADLKLFLDKHIQTLAQNETTLVLVRKVLRSNEKSRGILDGFLAAERDEIAQCLRERLKKPQIADALADMASNTTARAIQVWEQEEDLSLSEALDIIWAGTIEASRLLLYPQ